LGKIDGSVSIPFIIIFIYLLNIGCNTLERGVWHSLTPLSTNRSIGHQDIDARRTSFRASSPISLSTDKKAGWWDWCSWAQGIPCTTTGWVNRSQWLRNISNTSNHAQSMLPNSQAFPPIFWTVFFYKALEGLVS
jgi:hypothetical protein